MAELRYNPITRDWVMISSHRQGRPQMPEDWCPFCPGSGRVPEEGYTVLRYPNDFPALSTDPPIPDAVAGGLFRAEPAYGRCEVLLYSDRHTATMGRLPDGSVRRLAEMWRESFLDFAADSKIKYIFIFENRGEMVGVTMPHPHGQVYGYSFIPKKIQEELEGAGVYYREKRRCLLCDLLEQEVRDGRRILFSNEHFTVYVPFFSPVAYGVHICANRHLSHLGEMSGEELWALGAVARDCAGMYDSLFGFTLPYMMCMHNAPVNGPDCGEYYHFHVEFIPPVRAADKQQFFASSETGAGAWCNPTCPEEKAAELRAAYDRYLMM